MIAYMRAVGQVHLGGLALSHHVRISKSSDMRLFICLACFDFHSPRYTPNSICFGLIMLAVLTALCVYVRSSGSGEIGMEWRLSKLETVSTVPSAKHAKIM